MKILKNKTTTNSVRKVSDDDRRTVLFVLGTVRDLLADEILFECDAPGDWWGVGNMADFSFRFYESRNELLHAIGYGRKEATNE